MNPANIANTKESDVSSTPKLPTRNYGVGSKKSSFYRNVTSNSKFLNQELRNELKNEKFQSIVSLDQKLQFTLVYIMRTIRIYGKVYDKTCEIAELNQSS